MSGIVVWTATVDSDFNGGSLQLVSMLDDSERKRAERFARASDRRLFVAAHALKRVLLSKAKAFPPHCWRFYASAGGKPAVQVGPLVNFNLSHCDSLAACAVSETLEIGVDVEPIDREVSWEAFSDCLSEREKRWLRGLPISDQRIGFLRLWTLKEAHTKAIGKGMALAFDEVEFSLRSPDNEGEGNAISGPDGWTFMQRRIDQRHLLTLAWYGAPKASIEVRELSLAELLACVEEVGAMRPR